MAAAMTLWIAWVGLTGIGAALGGIPSVPVVALLTPFVMLSLALRAVVDSATTAALVVAAVLAVVGTGLPFDLGSVGAGIAGVIAGLTVDSQRSSKPGPAQEARV
jgi:predicted branched-subunit amino acid permease